MSTPLSQEAPAEWRMVHFREYPEGLDLLGKDLIGLLNHSKDEVSRLVGMMSAKSEMQTEELPGEYVTSLTGEIADEVHEWPKATFGSGFRHLLLQFREGRLIHMSWKFQGPPPRCAKPWNMAPKWRTEPANTPFKVRHDCVSRRWGQPTQWVDPIKVTQSVEVNPVLSPAREIVLHSGYEH